MLKRKEKSKFLTFADGWGTAYKVIDRRLEAVRQEVIHFSAATVGERRFWDAYIAGSEITAAVYVPLATEVDRGDVFVVKGADQSVIGSGQYEVVQRDFKDNVHPSAWLLSLQKANVEYRSKDDGNTH